MDTKLLLGNVEAIASRRFILEKDMLVVPVHVPEWSGVEAQ